MRKLLLVILSLLALGVAPAFAGFITFQDLSVGTNVTNQYVSIGVLFTPTGGATNLVKCCESSPGSLNYTDFNSSPLFSDEDDLYLEFFAPGNLSLPGWVSGSGLSFVLGDTESSVWIYGYDVNWSSLGSYHMTSTGPTTLSPFAGDVHALVFWDEGGDGFRLDSVQFGDISYVPEPATFALVGGALVTLGLIRRRRA